MKRLLVLLLMLALPAISATAQAETPTNAPPALTKA